MSPHRPPLRPDLDGCDLPGLIRLSSALEAVPGLPGGSALRAGAQALGQTGLLVGRVRHLLRGN